MKIEQTREILGEEAINISDEDIQKDIETAEYFKNIFFSMLHKGKTIK